MTTEKETPFSDLGSFEYSLLGQGQFRLLEITKLERRGEWAWPVCKLVHESIHDPPTYNALSYVWGPQDDQETISVNGKAFSVSQDLCDALCCLFYNTKPLVVWIDAICINQVDKIEKITQIPLMKDIYTRAACVVAWVGREKNDSGDLFLQMDHLSELLWQIQGRVTDSTFEGHGLPPEDSTIWPALDRFFYRPWFLRLWIFQEAILATNLIILCETKVVTWNSLERLVKGVLHTGMEGFLLSFVESSSEDVDPEMDGSGFVINLATERHWYQQQTGEKAMLMTFLLKDAQRLQCTFQVDRIYGFLGLVQEEVRKRIKIDYSLEDRFWEVWLQAGKVLSVVEQHSFYYLLECNDFSHKCPELPTWFPDLRWRPATTSFLWDEAAAGGDEGLSELCTFPDTDNLCIKGLPIGVVKIALPSSWVWPDAGAQAKGVRQCDLVAGLEWYREGLELAKISEMRSKNALEDYLLTITAGLFDSRVDGEMKWHRDAPLNQAKDTFSRMITFLEGFNIDEQTLKHPLDIGFLTWAVNITGSCDKRSFFTTASGRIGVGPSEMMEGDKVCAFQGMPWPFVLRWERKKSAHLLIGQAYVHGIMQGEAFRPQGDPGSDVGEFQNFMIC